jgi:hypothetical protein
MDALAALPREKTLARAEHWNRSFQPVPTEDVHEMEVRMGLEIAP